MHPAHPEERTLRAPQGRTPLQVQAHPWSAPPSTHWSPPLPPAIDPPQQPVRRKFGQTLASHEAVRTVPPVSETPPPTYLR